MVLTEGLNCPLTPKIAVGSEKRTATRPFFTKKGFLGKSSLLRGRGEGRRWDRAEAETRQGVPQARQRHSIIFMELPNCFFNISFPAALIFVPPIRK